MAYFIEVGYSVCQRQPLLLVHVTELGESPVAYGSCSTHPNWHSQHEVGAGPGLVQFPDPERCGNLYAVQAHGVTVGLKKTVDVIEVILKSPTRYSTPKWGN